MWVEQANQNRHFQGQIYHLYSVLPYIQSPQHSTAEKNQNSVAQFAIFPYFIACTILSSVALHNKTEAITIFVFCVHHHMMHNSKARTSE